jgi:glyoxylase-like metal-dependent hydrolase (beta-lactamase superfamily II)
MIVSRLPVGPLETNCYIIKDENTGLGVVIDPGFHAAQIMDEIHKLGADVKYIIFTHGHYDHTFAAREIAAETGAKIIMHAADAALFEQGGGIARYVFPPKSDQMIREAYIRPDRLVFGADGLDVGQMHFDFVASPGHTGGSMLILCDKAVFTGDTFMRGTIGRTDFPESQPEKMGDTIENVVKKLDAALTVYPGHGPVSDMARELRFNPFFQE